MNATLSALSTHSPPKHRIPFYPASSPPLPIRRHGQPRWKRVAPQAILAGNFRSRVAQLASGQWLLPSLSDRGPEPRIPTATVAKAPRGPRGRITGAHPKDALSS